MEKSTFSKKIPNSSIEEKKQYFIERSVNHPILYKNFCSVMEKINETSQGKVYLVYGPTGVGKSTLCKRIKKEILDINQDIIQKNKGIIPVISLELPAPDSGKFNWRDFYKRMLKEINEPLIEYKTTDKVVLSSSGKKRHIPNHFSSTAPELRESLENAVIHRKTKVILLDEAQHLLKVSGAKGIQDHMDAIKSLANLTNSIFILFGTYQLSDLFDLNGQLGRRTNEIHFKRYDIHDARERQYFKSVINTFQSHLPLSDDSDLISYSDFLYERTIGCIGILKEWIDACLVDALNNNLTSINLELLRKYAPSPSKALKIAEEIKQGEDKFKQQEEKLYQLQSLLKLNTLKQEIKKESNEKNLKDVGKRNPTRDRVGIMENEGK